MNLPSFFAKDIKGTANWLGRWGCWGWLDVGIGRPCDSYRWERCRASLGHQTLQHHSDRPKPRQTDEQSRGNELHNERIQRIHDGILLIQGACYAMIPLIIVNTGWQWLHNLQEILCNKSYIGQYPNKWYLMISHDISYQELLFLTGLCPNLEQRPRSTGKTLGSTWVKYQGFPQIQVPDGSWHGSTSGTSNDSRSPVFNQRKLFFWSTS